MAKYEATSDSSYRICPYCGDSYQVEAEDYNESGDEEQCEECGNKFYAYESFSVTCHAEPDCELNDQDHAWVPLKVKDGVHDFCSICGKCRPFH